MGSILSLLGLGVHQCGEEEVSENEIPLGVGPFPVYLVFADDMVPAITDTALSEAKRSHTFIIIDWGQLSSNSSLIGKKYDLTAQAATQATSLRISEINFEYPHNKATSWYKIGEIVPGESDIELFYLEFQVQMRRFNIQWEREKGKIWNNNNNCQQYARALSDHFHWSWPNDILVIDDSLFFIDYTLYFNSFIYSTRNHK